MFFRNQNSPARRSNRMGLKLAALLFSSLVMMQNTASSTWNSSTSLVKGQRHITTR